MRKRSLTRLLIGLVILLAIAAVAFTFWLQNRVILLVEKYLAISDGQYQAILMWAGMDPKEDIPSAVTDEEFQRVLGAVRVKKRAKSQAAPDTEFLIHLYDSKNQVTYSIELGQDHSISVARLDDLENSRTYWTDCDGNAFSTLYRECHLKNGGAALP